jgi:excisionase family DNA binding protein
MSSDGSDDRVEAEEARIARQYKTVREIANMFPVGEKRLYDAIKAGELRHIKKGRQFLLRIQSVDEWLRAQEVGGTIERKG